jgi:hypothetical protein
MSQKELAFPRHLTNDVDLPAPTMLIEEEFLSYDQTQSTSLQSIPKLCFSFILLFIYVRKKIRNRKYIKKRKESSLFNIEISYYLVQLRITFISSSQTYRAINHIN